MKKLLILCAALVIGQSYAQNQVQTTWPTVSKEARPGARWWWLGSGVDAESLSFRMKQYAEKGIGSLEIATIYGVTGEDHREIPYLSEKWMQMLNHTVGTGKELDIEISLTNGTGWPFGGPFVSIPDAATKLLIENYTVQGGQTFDQLIQPSDKKQQPHAVLSRLMAYGPQGKIQDLTKNVRNGQIKWTAPKGGEWQLIAAFNGKTLQTVKRAAPGGEGYVMDHFSKKAVTNYFAHFDKQFSKTKTSYPHASFNDSYEVYGADWTPTLFEDFYTRRGYKLENHLPKFLSQDGSEEYVRLITDYRQTLADMLLENFTTYWTNWAHKNGMITRNQAHGSPGNLIDLYATVDIPECEIFGISPFGIKGLRVDSLTRPNDSDRSMLKYASSGAHIAGKPLASSETFTWLTEHFRTSFSQCKPDLDQLFVSGINHVFFHGTTYSPKEVEWPGWLFYASVNMSPTNSIWRDAKPFYDYITRSQSFLQYGQPDNDFLVYLPVNDMWNSNTKNRMMMFDIHGMRKRAPQFIEVVNSIIGKGFDVDYISDNFVRSSEIVDKQIKTKGGTKYKAIIIDDVKQIPADVMVKLLDMARQGATIVFIGSYPEDVPGLANLEKRRTEFAKALKQLPKVTDFNKSQIQSFGKGNIITGSDYAEVLALTGVQPEAIVTEYDGAFIRRQNESGYHYFITMLNEKSTDGWVPLAVPAKSAIIYDPMTGASGKAALRQNNSKAEVFLQVPSGGSIILKTFTNDDPQMAAWNYRFDVPQMAHHLDKGWKLSFIESVPQPTKTFELDKLGSWTWLGDSLLNTLMGTGRYEINFELPENKLEGWVLDLGDVRESARVKLNGQDVATLWAVPYTVDITKYLKKGVNNLVVEVTNLPANRISEYDRQGIQWRKFKEINLVDINYKKTGYGHWQPVYSGLLGPVKIYPTTNYLKP